MGLRREAMAPAAMADRANAWSAQAPTNTSGKRVPPAANCCCKANPFMPPHSISGIAMANSARGGDARQASPESKENVV